MPTLLLLNLQTFVALSLYVMLYRWAAATSLVGLFSVIGFVDLLAVGVTAAMIGIFDADIGMMWFLAAFFAPALLLSQLYIAYRLVRHLGGAPEQAVVVGHHP